MDPKFAEAIKKSRQEGNDERRREYLESCDRGAKDIQQLFENEYHQKEALNVARKGHESYCTPAGNDIRNCIASKDHRECNEAKKKVSLVEALGYGSKIHYVCYNFPK